MKGWAIIFLSLFLISIVSAVPSLNFQNEEIQPGETIIATITTTGNFEKQIDLFDIKFYEGRKDISFEYDIEFYNNTHYLYIYTTREGNFSIEISDILYKEEDILKSVTIKKQFNITTQIIDIEETNETLIKILQIKPGFIFTTETPTLKLINKGTGILDIKYNKEEISLEQNELQEINIIPEETFSYFDILTYKKFSIPIIYMPISNVFINETTKNETIVPSLIKPGLKQIPEVILIEIFTTEKSEKTIELFNLANDTLSDFETISDFDFIEIEEMENMIVGESVNLTIILNPKNPGNFQGNINITYTQNGTQNILQVPLNLFILPKGSNESSFKIIQETCANISGVICESGYICSGEARFTKSQEYCCLGTCELIEDDKSEKDGYGWLLALIIIIVLVGVGYYFYNKQKNISPKKPGEQIRDSAEKYTERLRGKTDSKRVTGSTTKS